MHQVLPLYWHYMDPINQLALFDKGDQDLWDKDPGSSSTSSTSSCSSCCREAKEAPDPERSNSPSYLSAVAKAASSGPATHIVLSSLKAQFHSQQKVQGGRRPPELVEDLVKDLTEQGFPVDERRLVRCPMPHIACTH
jgi:hypothetical protein